MVSVGTHRDTLTAGCKPLWMVSAAQRQEVAVEKGKGGGRGQPRCRLAASGAGAADTALGAGQWGRTDGSSGAAACTCFRHLPPPQAPKSGSQSGHLLGKGRE